MIHLPIQFRHHPVRRFSFMKKMLLALFMVTLLVASTLCAQGEETMIRPRLVKTVTEYDIDYETNEWAPIRTWDFTYENDYPVSIDLHEIDADLHVITTFTYAFEDGLPTERKTYDSDGALLSVTEYHNGCVYNVYEEDEDRKYALFYQYGNGDEYFTMVLRDERSQSGEGTEKTDFYAEEVDAISVTVRDGLLAKTVNTGMYANWGGEEAKEWLRFSGTYTADYDEDGIVAVTSAVHRVGPSGIDGRYELTKADGAVVEGACYTPTNDGDWFCTARFSFEYTDTETTSARYAQMINSFLMGSESSYYKYNWY